MIEVCCLITELSIGGAQRSLQRLLEHLDRERFSVRVVCLYNGEGVVAKQIRQLGIPVTDLQMRSKLDLRAFWRLDGFFRRERPQILHTWMFHANLPGRVLGRRAGIPVIISSERTMGQEGVIRRWLNRRTSRLADCVVCVSEAVADYARQVIGIPGEIVRTIPNGVDFADFQMLKEKSAARAGLGLPVEGVLIGAIGRPRPVKGYADLIAAWGQIAGSHPQASLVLVGDGPQKPELERLARQVDGGERVFFLGDQEDIREVLAALDILAAPSHAEGMSNVILEALAAGLAVTAASVGGTAEMIDDGVSGLLVPPRAPAHLAAALARLIEAEDLRRRLGEAGQRRVQEKFSIGQTAAQTQALYIELLGRVRTQRQRFSGDHGAGHSARQQGQRR